MKGLVTLAFVVSLAACGAKTNPKEGIVNRQMQLNREMKPLYDSLVYMKDVDLEKRHAVEMKLIPLKREFDSLEFELKKY